MQWLGSNQVLNRFMFVCLNNFEPPVMRTCQIKSTVMLISKPSRYQHMGKIHHEDYHNYTSIKLKRHTETYLSLPSPLEAVIDQTEAWNMKEIGEREGGADLPGVDSSGASIPSGSMEA